MRNNGIRWGLKGVLFVFAMWSGHAGYAQKTAIKTNAAYWLTTTPNAGFELGLGRKSTVGISLGYNPFVFPSYSSDGKKHHPKLLHWFLLPEYRYWFCRPYERWFLGAYGIYGRYNVEGIPLLMNSDSRYRGWAAGGGVEAGYQWALGKRWGIEVSAGLGYLYLRYREYDCGPCGTSLGNRETHWVGPGKFSIAFSYFIY